MKLVLRWLAVFVVGALSGVFFFVLAYALFHSAVFLAEHLLRALGSL